MGFQTSWIGGLRTMKPDILTKLAAELQVPITSERQVVYIMVELRKLMELNGDGTLVITQKRPLMITSKPATLRG
jgi:hypothetical protein